MLSPDAYFHLFPLTEFLRIKAQENNLEMLSYALFRKTVQNQLDHYKHKLKAAKWKVHTYS